MESHQHPPNAGFHSSTRISRASPADSVIPFLTIGRALARAEQRIVGRRNLRRATFWQKPLVIENNLISTGCGYRLRSADPDLPLIVRGFNQS